MKDNAGMHRLMLTWVTRRCWTWVVMVGMVTSWTWGQTIEAPDAGALLREQQRQQQSVPERSVPQEVRLSEITLPVPDPNALSVVIQEIRFTGDLDLVKQARLQTRLQGVVGQQADFRGLQTLARWVTLDLRQQGYLLAQAILPQQDVTEGVITLHIMQGRLEGQAGDLFDLQAEGLRLSEDRLEAMAATALDPNGAVRQQDLERVLLLMNDLPAVSVQSVLRRGEEPGTTRLNLQVTQDRILEGMLWADNYGSRYSGDWRGNTQILLNDPWGQADQIRAYGTVARDYTSGTVGYQCPWGVQGMRFQVDVTALDYNIGKDLASARLEGSALMVPARLSYPLIRSRRSNLYLSTGVALKSLKDEQAGVTYRDRRVYSGGAWLHGDRRDWFAGGGVMEFSLGMVHGALDVSRCSQDHAVDQTTAGADGGFARFNARLARTQNLPGKFSCYSSVQAQWAKENLNSSEQFSLGGPYGIRAYPVNEGRGDEGWMANVELRYLLSQSPSLGQLQVKAFYDIGSIKLHHDPWVGAITTATGRNRYSLSGAGLGVTLIRAGRYQLSGIWAAAIGSNPGRSDTGGTDADGLEKDQRFWLQGILWF